MLKSKNADREENHLLVNDIYKVRHVLKNINWNFYQKDTSPHYGLYPFDCRKYHWYPATFVPQIPFTLIEVLTLPGAVIYDPFVGIGTTYFQALLLNRRPLATEICRVAIEYIKSLLALFNPNISFPNIKNNIKKMLIDFNPNENYIVSVPSTVLIDKLSPWYSETTLNQLSFLFIKEQACNDQPTKAAFRIFISSILNTVSSQDRGWGCIADNMLPKPNQMKDKDVFEFFSKRSNRLFEDISDHLKNKMPGYDELYQDTAEKQTIFHQHVGECEEIPENSVDLVVTSPPYPQMADYVTSQRLSYYFLGVDLSEGDQIKDSALEIGARKRRKRKDSLERYLEDMDNANKEIAKKVKSGGYLCYVMPFFNKDNVNNSNRRRIVQKVISNMETYDLIKEEEFERILPPIRRSHNLKWATLEREKIYLFRKV
ncbi:MAG: DNA methyltransferase [Candidatus Methanoperedens sp.]